MGLWLQCCSMAERTDATDVRTDSQKIQMAKHFEELEAEYRTEPRHHEVVYEDENVVVVADHSGHELNEWASDFDMPRSELSECMHSLARTLCDYSWSVSDPIVFDKLKNDATECIHCGAVTDEHGVTVRVETDDDGTHYTVCNVCEPPEDDE